MKFKLANVIIIIFVSMLLIGCNHHIHIKPSQMVSLGARSDPGETQEVRSGNPDGTGGGVFTVPTEKVLVITKVVIRPYTLQAGTLDITLIQSDTQLGDRIRQTWWVSNSQPTQFDYSPGYVVSSGSKLMIRNDTGSSGEVHVSLYGYIESDI
ncbi:MAG: hypothetical protein KAV87_56805 [Desulfobacteraceae bacterium]|nr:hypothetical protein [Desulfobacteraceae bacterium]